MAHDRLIIFAKNPELGKVKTRLAASMGHKKALEVYIKLLLHTRSVTCQLNEQAMVYFTSYFENSEQWSSYNQRLQVGDTLGVRMSNAFKESFDEGCDKVLIIGTDCYEITTEIISQAFKALDKQDVVIGPAADGGYYLLGMKRFHPDFFIHKRWSTETVFIDTVEDIKRLGLQHKSLPTLTDIDTEKEFRKFERDLI